MDKIIISATVLASTALYVGINSINPLQVL
jgi:hypothetical protein